MDTKQFFDFHTYIYNMVRHNRLATEQGFVPCSCSGIGFLEGVLARMRTARAFVCLSDICEESTVRHGGAWFKRRVFTVFVLARYDTRREDDYRDRLALCRELFRQMHSRFLVDEARLQSELCYLAVDEIRSRELGGQFINGCTGLYFLLALDEPTDLQFNADEWLTTEEPTA